MRPMGRRDMKTILDPNNFRLVGFEDTPSTTSRLFFYLCGVSAFTFWRGEYDLEGHGRDCHINMQVLCDPVDGYASSVSVMEGVCPSF